MLPSPISWHAPQRIDAGTADSRPPRATGRWAEVPSTVDFRANWAERVEGSLRGPKARRALGPAVGRGLALGLCAGRRGGRAHLVRVYEPIRFESGVQRLRRGQFITEHEVDQALPVHQRLLREPGCC